MNGNPCSNQEIQVLFEHGYKHGYKLENTGQPRYLKVQGNGENT